MTTFRPFTESDCDAVCGLIKSQEELFSVYPRGEFPLTPAQLLELSNTRMELTVAVEDDRIVGFANLYEYQAHQSAFVGNVIVDRDYRGRGLGRAIVSHMLKLGFEKYALPEVHISVFSGNTPALLLYVRFGFKPYDIEERVDPMGNRVALIHMKLRKTN